MDVEESERRLLRDFLREQARKRLAVNNKMRKARQLVNKGLDRIERQSRKNLVHE